MGAGQIGGLATVLGMDLQNAPGFLGDIPPLSEAQFLVYFLSHSVMFCTGVLLEPHVVLTAAACVYAERDKFQVFAGTHRFSDGFGVGRYVQNIAIHTGFNQSQCHNYNIALLVLEEQFHMRRREEGAQFVVNRLRYGTPGDAFSVSDEPQQCQIYGWGSRRNGLLLPMLNNIRRVNVTLMPSRHCDAANKGMLCVVEPDCKNDRFGALCPDDLGSALVCEGHLRGVQVSRAVNRPCGTGFLGLHGHSKFLTCGVDEARDITMYA